MQSTPDNTANEQKSPNEKPSDGKSLLRFVIITFIVLMVALTFCFIKTFDRKEEKVVQIITEEQPDTPIMYTEKYGFIVDSFDFVSGTIERNQNLSDILIPHGVSMQIIQAIADSSKKVFNVRKIRPGKTYTILLSIDTPKIAKYFIYEIDPVDYVVYKLMDSLDVYIGHNSVDTIIKSTSGIITSSLWNTMVEIGSSFDLIVEMESVYEWEVDFFYIAKNDKFKIIFEEKQIDGEIIGVGRILGAYFENRGEGKYAFYFVQDEKDDYFNDQGKSLRKAFLKAPLQYSRISSRFSRRRFHPVLKRYRPHSGVDYAAPTGTPIRAVGNGVVIKAQYSGGAGNYVKIKHNSTYTTGYMHLSRYGEGIKVGRSVKQGDVIGYVGTTGLSTGPHLDYRIWRNGKNINPLTLKLPPAKSVDSALMDSFLIIKDLMIKKLDKIEFPAENKNKSLDKEKAI